MTSVSALITTAFLLGSVHTLFGPDHYVPFAALARAGRWSLRKTLAVTTLCGLGHVFSSVVIGVVGIGAGFAVAAVTPVEEARAAIATWVLIGFGLAYGSWGVWRALRDRAHSHAHVHLDGTIDAHVYGHGGDHAHPHADADSPKSIVWVLFIVFVLGPCEPLIPLLMYPAATHDWRALALVTTAFGLTTILTMNTIVSAFWFGLGLVRLGTMERFSHAMAGGVLALSGLAVALLGL